MLTLRTPYLNVTNSVCFAPHNVFMSFAEFVKNSLDFLKRIYCFCLCNGDMLGRAMAQAVSRRPLTAETRIRSQASPCGICGAQSGTATGFSTSTSVFHSQFHSTGAHIHGKTKKLIILITRLHNKPQGCGASVTSAAGPFHKKYGNMLHFL